MRIQQAFHAINRTIALCLVAGIFSTSAWALKPSYEADRLLIAAEDAFAENNRQKAAEHLDAALRLGVALPADFNFLYGKLLVQQNKPDAARQYLEQYINREGSEGRFYREALSLITGVEKAQRAAPKTPTQSGGKAEIRRSDDAGSYVERIQSLYGTDDAAAALTQHLNNLLKFYAYGDDRIVASTRAIKPSRHKIQFSSRGEIISFNRIGGSAEDPFTEDRFSVFGVNPQISYECRASTSSCWLYHPVTSQRWLQIVRNEDVALEISKALSQLIRTLQKST